MEKNEKIPAFLLAMLKEQYGEEIAEKIVKGYFVKRKTTFRVNTLKTEVEVILNQLNALGIEYETVGWSKEAIILKNVEEKEVRNWEMYQKGEIYLQSLSSMLPPIILNPQKDIDILDMAAAPGGKTTQLAVLTQNRAHITACERNRIRAERLQYNIEKQGASNVYIMQVDSRNMEDFFAFDSVLLDSPCSGSGTLRFRDDAGLQRFTKELIEKSTKLQISLLRKAMKVLKSGQEMVYSTCSVLACENEEIVGKVLQETKAEIVPIELEGIGELPRLPVEIEGTLGICPNELFEGFFVAKMRKK